MSNRPDNQADWIEEVLDEYENGQNPHQSEEYRLSKAVKAITTKIAEERIAELKLAEGEWLLMSPDVSEFVHYCIDRIAQLEAGLRGEEK